MSTPRFLAALAILAGLYLASRQYDLHNSPVINESLNSLYTSLQKKPQEKSPAAAVVVDQSRQQEVFTTESASRTPYTRRIVAVGDLHGDYPNAQRVLQFAGVVDKSGNWTGNVDFFVQTGDIVDRGDDTIKLFFWMEHLRVQAAAAGGVVLSHLGNHEVMNAIGDWRYVYPSEIKTFGSVEARQKMLSTGRIGRAWAQNYTATSRLPLHPHLGPPNTPFPPADHPVHFQRDDGDDELEDTQFYDPREPLSHAALSFVHGGLSPTYSNLAPFPTKINALSASFLEKLQNRPQPPPSPPNPYPGLPPGTTQEERELYDANGPFWYRGWATDSEEKVCVDVEKVLARTGTRRMIMGHTPDFTGIVSRCNGKVIIIDTGISHAYGGVLSALSIDYIFTPVESGVEDGELHWIEREVVKTLYIDKKEDVVDEIVIVDEERQVTGDFRLV